MKKLFAKPGSYISLAVMSLLSVWACNKSTTPIIDSQTSTVSYVLANGTNTTIFNSAVIKAGLDSVFSSPALFTLFVPNDEACTQSGYTQTVVNGFSRDQARQWVLYQTYAGTLLTLESFIGKTEQKLVMADGDSIFVSGDSNRTFVNGYQMLNSEIKASNGMMLALQYVLLPPQKNLSEIVSSDSSLSFLNEAILKSSPIPDSLTTLLATGGPFTFLAPVNDAFRILGFNTPSDLDTLNPDSLRNMILLSMVPQRLFSYDITDSSTYMSANDSTLLFANSGVQTSVRVLGSAFSSNIIAANLMAINGVLFKIDSVLDH